MNVSWFSAGVSSFIATYLERDSIDKIIYIDIDNQHEDSMRFVKDCEKVLGKEIEILKSRYASVDNVVETFRFINSRYGAKCTDILKKRVRKEWEIGKSNLSYVWGYDVTEKHRAERLVASFPESEHSFPLITNNITKEFAHGMLEKLGIKRPIMYDMGYKNNNCIGCVKGGMGYWNKIRNDFPEVFQRRAEQERLVSHSCINGTFLDELDPSSGRIQDEVMADCGIFCELNIFERRK